MMIADVLQEGTAPKDEVAVCLLRRLKSQLKVHNEKTMISTTSVRNALIAQILCRFNINEILMKNK